MSVNWLSIFGGQFKNIYISPNGHVVSFPRSERNSHTNVKNIGTILSKFIILRKTIRDKQNFTKRIVHTVEFSMGIKKRQRSISTDVKEEHDMLFSKVSCM